ncbi:MAG: NAD(P)/FAD-dependent oxidoreductase [Candidatus Caenarcaniphilales bacterium]|nr:NAD(P)/FAD-dependent oxidoreductase [Candidatus Caenarcaniphilales bacterium]
MIISAGLNSSLLYLYMSEVYDVAVIGAGPVGMMAAYYAGTRGLKPILIDILDTLGGQCSTLYPEKMIFDVASQPGCTGSELIARLTDQLSAIEHDLALGTSIDSITPSQDDQAKPLWILHTHEGKNIIARVVIIAVGKGAFQPRRLGVPGEDLQGVYYTVKKLDLFNNKHVLIVGGGDSAMDWALALKSRAESLVQIHRTDKYRAHGGSLNQVLEAVTAGEMQLKPFYEIKEIHGRDGAVSTVTIFDNRSKMEETFTVDQIVISAGFLTNLGSIAQWGLQIDEHQKLIVDPTKGYATNLPNVFAIGDIAHFEGKVELIITGFGEAATAAYYAYKAINGELRGAAWCAKLPVSAR